MTPLLADLLEAHGGLARWRGFQSPSARLQQGGALWALKGQADVLSQATLKLDLHAADGQAQAEPLVVSIDLSDIALR